MSRFQNRPCCFKLPLDHRHLLLDPKCCHGSKTSRSVGVVGLKKSSLVCDKLDFLKPTTHC